MCYLRVFLRFFCCFVLFLRNFPLVCLCRSSCCFGWCCLFCLLFVPIDASYEVLYCLEDLQLQIDQKQTV